MKRTVIILTASSKYGNFCVSGIDAYTGEWIRLVSDDAETHGALSSADMLCTNGKVCSPLDTVDVELEKAVPSLYQPENWLIKKGSLMKYRKRAPFSYVLEVHPPEKPRLLYNNKRAFLYEKEYNYITQSLILIRAEELVLRRKKSSEGKNKLKASFIYNGISYTDISLTDPQFYRMQDGYTLTSVYLVVSLPTVPYANGLFYKFVAKVFPAEDCRNRITPPEDEAEESPTPKKDVSEKYQQRKQRLIFLGKTAANTPWLEEEERKLSEEFYKGLSVSEIADIHKRTESAIKSRLRKLGLIE